MNINKKKLNIFNGLNKSKLKKQKNGNLKNKKERNRNFEKNKDRRKDKKPMIRIKRLLNKERMPLNKPNLSMKERKSTEIKKKLMHAPF